MKLAVTGDWHHTDPTILFSTLATITEPIDLLVTGSSKGIDRLVKQYGHQHGIPVHVTKCPQTPKVAGLQTWLRQRDAQLVQVCDAIIFIGRFNACQGLASKAKEKKKPFVRVSLSWIPTSKTFERVDERAQRIAARYGEEI